MTEWIAQAIGILASVIFVLSYQFRFNKGVFWCQMVSAFFFSVNMFLLGAYGGCILNILATVRGVFLLIPNQKGITRATMYLMFFITLFCFGLQYYLGFITYVWLDFLLMAQFMVGTYCCFRQDGRLIRMSQLFVVSPVCLVYNGLFYNVGGILTECVNIISIIISLIRFGWNGFERKEKNKHVGQ